MYYITTFLKYGANPYLVDHNLYNALIHAFQHGHIQVAHMLLKYYPQLLNCFGHTGNAAVQWTSYYQYFNYSIP